MSNAVLDRETTSYLSRLDEGGVLPGRFLLVDAENATLRLADPAGRQRSCTDFMSAFAAVNFGHRNPAIVAAMRRPSDLAAPFQTADAELVARWLCRRLGGTADRRVLFQIGGSFAVSTALALARRHRPGRVLGVRGAFHGLGVDAAAVTTVQREFSLQDTGFVELLDTEVGHLTPGEVPEDWSGVSCVIYEPVQGANGYVPLDVDWLRRLSESARSAGVLLIADEIQCGFHRHGPFSPSTTAGLDPDVVLFSKSLTNGMYPLSAVVYKQHLERDAAAVYLAHTFQTGTMGPAAAIAVAAYLDSHDVAAMAAAVERPLRDLAGRLAAAGLADEVHVTGPALSFRPTERTSRAVVAAAFEAGVLVFAGGRHGERIRIAPPLTVPADQLRAGVDTLWNVLNG
ncbi:aminotransferase class III-fold pyridoxal phosphate-dependent enzyme [Micromonospora sp. NPDC000442]|uniref:aminotransferase class III-fold pyridoxal phosphate-dependent enzyme n=1 Tax=Micromonospora sp. NPDC000442 TaxID=3364217 RepID=UPI0036C3481A